MMLSDDFVPSFDLENMPRWVMCPKCFRTDRIDLISRAPKACPDCDTPFMIGCLKCNTAFKTKPKKRCSCGFDFKVDWRESFVGHMTIYCLSLYGETLEREADELLLRGRKYFPVFSNVHIEKDVEYIPLLREYELDSLAIEAIGIAKKMLSENDR